MPLSNPIAWKYLQLPSELYYIALVVLIIIKMKMKTEMATNMTSGSFSQDSPPMSIDTFSSYFHQIGRFTEVKMK